METPVTPEGSQGALNVKLKIFEGPLDLLLHLIRNHKVEIYDIPMAEITAQYLEYLELMKNLNLDIASEFLVMAATLTHIKSRMLLPVTEEEEEDPRDELIQRLLEYQRYKEASLKFRDMRDKRALLRSREPADGPQTREEVFLEVSIFELLKAFREVIVQVAREQDLLIRTDQFSVVDKMSELMEALKGEKSLVFQEFFRKGSSRSELVATFLALLELVRLRMVRLSQKGHGEPIRIIGVKA